MRVERQLLGALSGLSLFSVLSSALTFGFMAIAARNMNTEEFSKFTIAWSLVYTIAGSVLAAAEPEMTRLMLARSFSSVKRVIAWVLVLLLSVPMFIAFLATAGVGGLDFDFGLAILTSFLLLAMFVEVISRAVMASGAQRMRYGLVAPADAVGRIAFLLLAVMFLSSIGPHWVFVAMILGSAVVGGLAATSVFPSLSLMFKNAVDLQTPASPKASGYGYLLLGTAAMTGLISGVPLIIGFTTAIQAEELALVGAALLIARVPLIFIMGFESVLVQEFNARLSSRSSSQSLALLLVLISGLTCIAGLTLGHLIGPETVRFVAGSSFEITRNAMSILSGASGLLLGGILLTPLCISLGRHWQIAASWLLSLMVFALSTTLTGDTINAVALALALAAAVCVVCLAVSASTAGSRSSKTR